MLLPRRRLRVIGPPLQNIRLDSTKNLHHFWPGMPPDCASRFRPQPDSTWRSRITQKISGSRVITFRIQSSAATFHIRCVGLLRPWSFLALSSFRWCEIPPIQAHDLRLLLGCYLTGTLRSAIQVSRMWQMILQRVASAVILLIADLFPASLQNFHRAFHSGPASTAPWEASILVR